MSDWTTIVLSGGASTRMGRDKATLELAGKTLLDRTMERIPDDVPVIVSGPVVPVERAGVRFVREEPPGGGPVAGIDAALALVETPVVVVLAGDLPFVGAAPKQLALALLSDAGDDDRPRSDVVMPTDADGHMQMLCAAYRTDALREAIGANGDPRGASMRSVVARLRSSYLAIGSIGTPNDATNADQQPQPSWDIDTPQQLLAAAKVLASDGDNNEDGTVNAGTGDDDHKDDGYDNDGDNADDDRSS